MNLERLNSLEEALLAASIVDDCLVVRRRTTEDESQIVAYVVTQQPLDREGLTQRLGARGPSEVLPDVYVPVSSLPLTGDGQVDEAALWRIPVLEPEAIEDWERHLASVPGVQRAAVVRAPHSNGPPRLAQCAVEPPNPDYS